MSILRTLGFNGRRARGWRPSGVRTAGSALRVGFMIIASVGLVAGGLEGSAEILAARRTGARSTAAAAGAWAQVYRPIAVYDLAGTDFAKLPRAYAARRHSPDGAREDVLSFGHLGDGKPFLQLSLLRRGAGPGAEVPDDGLADGLARLASSRGFTASRIRAAVPVETRLGTVEAADLLLWDGAGATPCVGFRGAPDGESVFQMAGFACGRAGHPMGRASLACAIDRIDLVSAGDDDRLRAVFVAAERRGGATCLGGPTTAPTGSLLGPGRRLGWLDPDGELPPMRGLFATTDRRR